MTSSVNYPSEPVEGWRLSDAELVRELGEIEGARRRILARYLDLLSEAEARGVAAAAGFSGVGALVQRVSGCSRGAANRLVRRAIALRGLPCAASALSVGSISGEHVDVIEAFRLSLSDAVHPAEWDDALPVLVELSKSCDPAAVKWFAENELRSRIDPDGAFPSEPELAEPRNDFAIEFLNNGWARLRGRLEQETALLLKSQLDPMAAPAAPPEGGPDPRTPAQRYGTAFRDWVHLGHAGLPMPSEGGERPHVAVTIPLELLLSGIGHASIGSDGLPICASEARRLACDSSIIPIVLDADSLPLDIGRASRTIPPAIRRAVVNRDKHCAFPGCAKPGSWCQVHHIREWQDGGETKLSNLALLCRTHHRLIHHSAWEVRITDGFPEFIPPDWLPVGRAQPTRTRREP